MTILKGHWDLFLSPHVLLPAMAISPVSASRDTRGSGLCDYPSTVASSSSSETFVLPSPSFDIFCSPLRSMPFFDPPSFLASRLPYCTGMPVASRKT